MYAKRGTQFRIWANDKLKDYMIKGFIVDAERLKSPDGRADYFDELLESIRDIRARSDKISETRLIVFSKTQNTNPLGTGSTLKPIKAPYSTTSLFLSKNPANN